MSQTEPEAETVEDLKQRIEDLEARVDEPPDESEEWGVKDLTQLGLTRREALYVVAAMAAGYTFREAFLRATGRAEAGTQSVGDVGTADNPVDAFLEDVIGPSGTNPVTFQNDIQAGSGKLNIQTGMSTPAVDTEEATTKSKPVHDVTHPDFGAVGDNATDDKAAIQSAIDAAEPGGIVWFPNKTFLVDTVTSQSGEEDFFLQVNGNDVTLAGPGTINVTKDSPSTDIIQIDAATGVDIRQLTIDGPGKTTDPTGIHYQPDSDGTVKDALVTDCGGIAGIDASNKSADGGAFIRVVDCTAKDCVTGFAQSNGAGFAMFDGNRAVRCDFGYKIFGVGSIIRGGEVDGEDGSASGPVGVQIDSTGATKSISMTKVSNIHIQNVGDGVFIQGKVNDFSEAYQTLLQNITFDNVDEGVRCLGAKGVKAIGLAGFDIGTAPAFLRSHPDGGVSDDILISGYAFRGDGTLQGITGNDGGVGTVHLSDITNIDGNGEHEFGAGADIILDDEIVVQQNADTPSATGEGPVAINFTDTGDGSGDGIYYEDRGGTVHGPI